MTDNLSRQLTAQFYRGNRAALALSVAGALLAGTLNLAVSWLIQQLVDVTTGAGRTLSLAALGLCSAGLLALCAVSFLLRRAFQPKYIQRAMEQYRNFAFQRLTEKGISSFRQESTALYLSALTNDAASVEENYLAQQLSLITTAVQFFGALGMMLWYSPVMTAIAAALTVLPLLAALATGQKLEQAERNVSDRNRDFTAALSDCLGGFTVVKSFQAEKEIFRLFARNNAALCQQKGARRRVELLVTMIGAMAGLTAQLGVFFAGAFLAVTGRGLTAGTVLIFVNLMNFVIQPVQELPGLLAKRKAALGLVDKLADALNENAAPAGQAPLAPIRQGIRLRDVTFGYELEKPVLHHISVEFQAGKSYAIVGGSGSGKSTLLNLLMGGAADYTGSVTFDGTELRRIAPDALYGQLSVIQQNVFVFDASIRDNVTMFRDFPQPDIDAALSRARLTELTAQRGADYLCGENGKNLSGGEKQRISIARSLLKRSTVLLADEVTAALDAQTAHQVAGDLLDLTGVTRIIVTHALDESLLRRYDGILAMKDGRLEEMGTFEELMEKKGYFYALFRVGQ